MKKFVLFLMIVFMGVFSASNSYAKRDLSKECKPRKELKIGASGDDNLYLDETDFDLTFNQPNYSLKCDTALGDDEHCWDNTLVFVTKKTFIGDALAAANKSIIPFTDGPTLIKCKVGINDKWEKVGGIDKLPECGNSAPEKTITVNGKTVRCKRKETRGNQEYCTGIESGDICIESGNGKPAEKPKEAEQKKEAKTEPIEENNEPKETCDTNQGYEYNPVSKKCERTEAEKAEEKKEDPKKEEKTETKKSAPKAKQKSGKDIFRDDCLAEAPIRGVLDQDGTTCTLTDETITDIDALNKAIETYNQKFGKARGKCASLTYKGIKIWSTACTAEDGFVGTWLIHMPKITCEETQIFNDDTGKCDTKAAEEPAKAENDPATNGSEETPAEEAAPAAATGEDNSNDEWAALHNDAKRIVRAYNDQKTKLKNVEQPKEEETAQPNENKNKSTPVYVYAYQDYTATSLDDVGNKVGEYCKQNNITLKTCQKPDTSRN